jgi:Transport and Golgi organisation 2
MCTVTVIPFRDAGFRIACNRDESNTRPAALPPRLRQFGNRSAILPIDPISDGTWIAVNDAGLAMVLLNRNPTSETNGRPLPHPSRGTIIPALLHCDDIHRAKRLACKWVTTSIAPFRLILVGHGEVVEVSVVHSQLRLVERKHVDSPMMFTSSGLGDELVDGPRRQLFQEWFQAEYDWVNQQDSFHGHFWHNQEHVSVCMRRSDARTVSYTVIELRSESASITYSPQAPNQSGPSVSHSLALHGMVPS